VVRSLALVAPLAYSPVVHSLAPAAALVYSPAVRLRVLVVALVYSPGVRSLVPVVALVYSLVVHWLVLAAVLLFYLPVAKGQASRSPSSDMPLEWALFGRPELPEAREASSSQPVCWQVFPADAPKASLGRSVPRRRAAWEQRPRFEPRVRAVFPAGSRGPQPWRLARHSGMLSLEQQ
jgi:hypothetical protein